MVPQGRQIVLMDRVFLEVLPVVVGKCPGHQVLDVIDPSQLLQTLNRQGQELDENVKAPVLWVNG
jgi:hypothetical protein